MRRLINLALLTTAAILCYSTSAEAAQKKMHLVPGDQARAITIKNRMSKPAKGDELGGNEIPQMTRNGQGSILTPSELTPNDSMNQGEYKFNLYRGKYATIITSVEKDGKPVLYTKELHEQLKEGMQKDLQNIIKDNIAD